MDKVSDALDKRSKNAYSESKQDGPGTGVRDSSEHSGDYTYGYLPMLLYG
jgi:hypothetical protein